MDAPNKIAFQQQEPVPGRISIVTPCYNYGRFLGKAIESALNQDYPDLELIIVDDASTDNSAAVAKRYMSDPRVRYHRNETNLGAVPNVNHSYSLATGEFVLLLGADDFLMPRALKLLHAQLAAHADLGFAYGMYVFANDQDRITGLVKHPGHPDSGYVGGRDEFADLLAYDCYINMGACLFRRATLEAYGGFDESLKIDDRGRFFRATDWDLTLRLGAAGVECAFVNTPISAFRIHGGQASTGDNYIADGVQVLEHLTLLERYVAPEYYARLAPRAQRIEACFLGKVDTFERTRPESSDVLAAAATRIARVSCRLKQAGEHAGLVARAVPSEPMDSDAPLVSVVIPTRNRPDLLSRALESVAQQTYPKVEVVVVNDGGEPIEALLGRFKARLAITYVASYANRGAAASRNAGLGLTRGEFIAFLDDDDNFLPNHLALAVAALRDGAKRFAYGQAEYLTEEIDNGNVVVTGRGRPYAGIAYSPDELAVRNFIPTPTWVFHRSLVSDAGFFNEEFSAFEDWDWLLRAARHTDFATLPETTVEVHTRLFDQQHLMTQHRPNLREWYERIYAKHAGSPTTEQARGEYVRQVFGIDHRNAGEREREQQQLEQSGNLNIARPSYAAWLERQRPSPGELEARLQRAETWESSPLFHLILELQDGEDSRLADTIDSLAAQAYWHWSLTVVSPRPCPDPLFEELPQLTWHSGAFGDTQTMLAERPAQSDDEWIWFVQAGDRLEPHALLAMAETLRLRPDWRVVYVDDDMDLDHGASESPRFKPDFNLELARTSDYLGAILARRSVVDDLGGIAGSSQANSLDFVLRTADSLGANTIGHVTELVLHRPSAAVTAVQTAASTTALERHFQRRDISAAILPGKLPGTRRIDYTLEGHPTVSILIVAEAALPELRRCIESVLATTSYAAFEILVALNDDPALRLWLTQAAQADSRLRLWEGPVGDPGYSLRNGLAASASGEYLAFLDCRTTVIEPTWLETLLKQAQQADVGAVGPCLVDPMGGIRDAGVILGLGPYGIGNEWHTGLNADGAGYLGRMQVAQDLSAVSAACLVTRRETFDELAGFRANRYKRLYADIDYCLRLRQINQRVVWIPDARLAHTGPGHDPQSASGGMYEVRHMLEDWLPELANDPAYNPHLNLVETTPALETVTDLPWHCPVRDVPRVVALPLDNFGLGEYRLKAPLRQLTAAGRIQSHFLPNHIAQSAPAVMSITELVRAAPDTVFWQEALTDPLMGVWEAYRRYTKTFLIYTQDDLVFQLPAMHPLAGRVKDYKKRLRKMLSLSDRLIVGTQPMADALSGMIDDIRLVPNRLEWSRWGHLESATRESGRLRVGWAGGAQHQGDLLFLLPILEATAEYVDWVFFGMCPEPLAPYVAELHRGVTFDDYPAKLASLGLDLALAPLERNNYNEAKSNLRLLEYGILGMPVICTDIYPYQKCEPPLTRLPNVPSAWIKAILERVNERETLRAEGQKLRDWVVESWILENHLDEWYDAITRA